MMSPMKRKAKKKVAAKKQVTRPKPIKAKAGKPKPAKAKAKKAKTAQKTAPGYKLLEQHLDNVAMNRLIGVSRSLETCLSMFRNQKEFPRLQQEAKRALGDVATVVELAAAKELPELGPVEIEAMLREITTDEWVEHLEV